MYTSKTQFGIGGSVNYHANVPFLVAPKILKKIKIEGVEYYRGEKGRLFLKVIFDKMFKPII